MNKTEAIKAFLMANAPRDLAELYNANMECQVNVAQDGGTRVESSYQGRQWHGWTDEHQLTVWKSFRIPYKASTQPEFNDTKMSYSLDAHAEGIGMTGWDWKNLVSRWFAFDFDAISGHSDKHQSKLTQEQLKEVQDAASSIPWVTVRKSTSGKGLHLYVFLEPIPTSNHNEHAALARAMLGKMSIMTKFDFSAKVDICGGNMWCWHRKMRGTDGLQLIKQGEMLSADAVPVNWRDHVKVVKGRAKKAVPKQITESDIPEADRMFEELCGKRTTQSLDDDHKKLIKYLEEKGAHAWWDNDHGMLVAHTYDLKCAHEELNMRGIFRTMSEGTERGMDKNCFGGHTTVLTQDGPKKFKDLAGKSVKLYVRTDSGMKWIESEIKSFGVQNTYPMVFGDGTVVRTTYGHMWIDANRGIKIPTHDVTPGRTEVPIINRSLPNIDWEGYAHGFVFGDGNLRNQRGIVTTEVPLFKHDNDLRTLLCKYGNPGTQKFKGKYVNCVRQLPKHWKELPENPSKEYALGFILGLASADGAVNNQLHLFQTNLTVIQEVERLAVYCGLRPYPIKRIERDDRSFKTSEKYRYAIGISTHNLTQDHFLRSDHKKKLQIRNKGNDKTTICFIDWNAPAAEEVYCAVVPVWENFTLGNSVLTGNCYLFPNRRGSWTVRRFTPGVKEDPTWNQDGAGWTYCYLNKEADLKTAARAYEGVEQEKGGFFFQAADQAQQAAQLLGVNLNLPTGMLARKGAVLKEHSKDGRLMASIPADPSTDDAPKMTGWLNEKGMWKRIYGVQVSTNVEEAPVQNYDDTVRHIVTSQREDAGWVLRSDDRWSVEPLGHVKEALLSTGVSKKDITTIVGQSIIRPWEICNLPFQPEYPGERKWNRDAAQVRFHPSEDRENLKYPTWDKILQHLGRDLDEAVKENSWAINNGIVSGADYLKCWIASLFQEPTQPLPYLFFWSTEQNTGKSTLHEALRLLVTKGYVRADHALSSNTDFNGELENAVICVIEETDLGRNNKALNRIKDWVTSPMLPIRRLYQTAYAVVNTTHWIQCNNSPDACPILPGDSRIVMIHVSPLDLMDMIPKKALFPLLEAEAPDFLASVLALELPESNDRLNIPIIETKDKLATARNNQTPLDRFLQERCHHVPGEVVEFSEFYERFIVTVEPSERGEWSKIKVGRNLPIKFPGARLRKTGFKNVGNISWFPANPDAPPKKNLIIDKEGYLAEDDT